MAIVPEWYPSGGRPVLGTFVRDQALAVAPHADVTVYYRDPDLRPTGGRWSWHEERDGALRVVRIATAPAPVRQADTLLATFALDRAIRAASADGAGPDLIHAHVFSAGLRALFVARRRGVPAIVSEHLSAFATGIGRWDRLVARQVHGRVDLACPVSEDLAGRLRQLAPRARLRVVPNSVDTDLFRPAERADAADASRLLAVGMLHPVKGVDRLIDALPAVRRRFPDVALDIVGDGPELERLRRRAEEAGVAGSVTFHGRLAKPEVARLMRAAGLFVLPSLWENLPCVVIEALASGLPVVASRVGGVPEMVGDRDGLLVEPGDPAALADAIVAALADPARWDRRAIAAAAHATYGFEATGRLWADIYAELIAARR